MAAPSHPTALVSDHGSASSSQGQHALSAKEQPATPFLTRRRRIALAVVAAVVVLGLVLGLSLGLTLGRRNSSPSPSTSSSDDNGNNDNDEPLTTAPPRGTYPNPHPIVGTVPNNANWTTLDPTLVRRASDGKLFLYTTGGGSGYVWTSPSSLTGPWTKSPQSLVPKGTQAGAPDIHRWNDTTYLMFHNSHAYNYSASAGVANAEAQFNWHDASIVARTSTTLEPGSWQEVGRLEIDWAMRYNILDPALLRIPAGRNKTAPNGGAKKNLLTFGSYQTGLYQIPLDAEFPARLADKAMSQMTHLERNETNKIDTTEAAYMYYHEGTSGSGSGSTGTAGQGWYYLFFSSGRCCPVATVHHNHTSSSGSSGPTTTTYTISGGATTNNETKISWFPYDEAYRVMVCRSRTPRGEYFDRAGRSCLTQSGGTVVLASHDEVFAPGGQGIWDDEVEGPVLYYHYVSFNLTTNRVSETDKGYKFGWNKLDFRDDGWPRVVS
ncbi:arabinan endo-1,5-alpha-L-arabinosidase [Microdochium nivale]|nr:arabinan endo-1,5-alpha-L-arabinosidase [Microdochium nivale]